MPLSAIVSIFVVLAVTVVAHPLPMPLSHHSPMIIPIALLRPGGPLAPYPDGPRVRTLGIWDPALAETEVEVVARGVEPRDPLETCTVDPLGLATIKSSHTEDTLKPVVAVEASLL